MDYNNMGWLMSFVGTQYISTNSPMPEPIINTVGSFLARNTINVIDTQFVKKHGFDKQETPKITQDIIKRSQDFICWYFQVPKEKLYGE